MGRKFPDLVGGFKDLAAFLFMHGLFAVDTFFLILSHRNDLDSRNYLGAQTQHKVIQRFLPPSASKQSKSEITRAGDKGVVLSNIGQAISGSTVRITDRVAGLPEQTPQS